MSLIPPFGLGLKSHPVIKSGENDGRSSEGEAVDKETLISRNLGLPDRPRRKRITDWLPPCLPTTIIAHLLLPERISTGRLPLTAQHHRQAAGAVGGMFNQQMDVLMKPIYFHPVPRSLSSFIFVRVSSREQMARMLGTV
jgi:hypothetical protein